MPSESKFIEFENRLQKVYKHLGKIARKKGVSCYRLYDLDLPDFPFLIDVYGSKVYVAEYERNHTLDAASYQEWQDKSLSIIGEVLEILPESIHLKTRKSIKERQDQYEKYDSQASYFTVQENGLSFLINLTDYLDTGLFLDHRPTRQIIREESKGKVVLNLFAYTASFSVYAAAGGASEVHTVDMSKTYIDWAKENMKVNGFVDFLKYKYVQADVIQELINMPKNYFDIIILDPPTFSNSKRMQGSFDVQRDHVELIAQCHTLMRSGGQLYFSTNYTKFKPEMEQLAFSQIKDITARTTDFDFERKLQRKCYLMIKE